MESDPVRLLTEPLTREAGFGMIGMLGKELRAASLVATEAKAGTAILDVNKLNHIFVEKHNLGAIVTQFGSRENAFVEIQKAATAATHGVSGVFEKVVKVGTETVTVRGSVVDGAVKIGTVFKP